MVRSRTLGGLSLMLTRVDVMSYIIIINARRRVARPCLAGHVSAQKRHKSARFLE